MPKAVSVILHWNIDYAEFPRNELTNLINRCYSPTLDALEDFEGKMCFNLTGHTIDTLKSHSPDIIDKIKEYVNNKTVELVATGYSHPILPLLPKNRIKSQLKDQIELLVKEFNSKPKGCWPPELAVSPVVLSEMVKFGIEWVTIDYEHLKLAQFYGNDINLFERREQTVTEVLADAFWARGVISKLRKYRCALKKLNKENSEFKTPLERVKIHGETTIRAFLSSQSWWNSTKFALSGDVPIYNEKKHLKAVLRSKANYLPIYTSDVEFFGYRELGGKVPPPRKLTEFLKKLQKMTISVISPSDIPNDEWEDEPKFIGAGSWAPDKSIRLWTDSEDNREYLRRLNEIYIYLEKLNWDQKVLNNIEKYLRIAENSDAHGWQPIPERKHEAYSALHKIYEIINDYLLHQY